MKARLVGALILLPSLVLADATSDAFNTGAEFGKGNKGQGTSSLKNPDAVIPCRQPRSGALPFAN